MDSEKKRFPRWLVPAALAFVLVLGASIGTAMSYFTTYAEAEGGAAISQNYSIRERVSDWTKHISITAEKDSDPVFVRAKIFSGSAYTMDITSESGKWTLNTEDGFYYYSDALEGGSSTEDLLCAIGNIPEVKNDVVSFNIIVVYECTDVLIDNNGNEYADWNNAQSYSAAGETTEGGTTA